VKIFKGNLRLFLFISVLWAASMLFLPGPVTAAESGESRVRSLVNNEGYKLNKILTDQPVNKVFTVQFSLDPDIDTVSSGVEFIEKESGASIAVNCAYAGSHKVTIAPAGLLTSGRCYYLILHKTIKDTTGTHTLSSGVVQEISAGGASTSLTVDNVNITASKELEIRFNTAVDSTTASNKKYYAVYDANSQQPLQIASAAVQTDARRVKLLLVNDIDAACDQISLTIYNNIKNIYGTPMGNLYQRDLYIVNREAGDWSSDSSYYPRQMKGSVDILAPNRQLVNASVSGDVYVGNDKVTLQNLKVEGKIFIDPGVAGTTTVQNVEAGGIEILSGADSILLTDVKTNELLINSRSAVKVKAQGQTDIFRTVVQFKEYNVSLQTDTAGEATFGRMEISAQSLSGKQLELQGCFEKPIEVYKGLTIKNLAGVVKRIDLCMESQRTPATVKLVGICSESSSGSLYSGYFTLVNIKQPVALDIEHAQVGTLDLQTLGVDITADRLTYVRKVNTYGRDALIKLEDGAWVGAPAVCTVVLKPGTIQGTTSIKKLVHPLATSFYYKVQTGEFTTWPAKLDNPQDQSLSSSFAHIWTIADQGLPSGLCLDKAAKSKFTQAGLTQYTGSEDLPVLIRTEFGHFGS
jgi:hypothetical protein